MRTLFPAAVLMVLAACAGNPGEFGKTGNPTTHEGPIRTRGTPRPPPGPCSTRNEAFAGVTETVYTYAEGRRTRAVQTGPGGQRQTLWSYDEQGRRKEEVSIEGEQVTTRRFVYDGDLLVREDVFEGDAEQAARQHRRRYDGGLLRERTEARFIEGSWVVLDTHALHYDDADRFVYELRTRTPTEGPRTVESITVEVDTKGRVIARRVDVGMDGSVDRVSLYSFDDQGRLAVTTEMEAGDLDSVTRYAYDERGRLVRSAVEDGAGEPLGLTTYDFSCWEAAAPRG